MEGEDSANICEPGWKGWHLISVSENEEKKEHFWPGEGIGHGLEAGIDFTGLGKGEETLRLVESGGGLHHNGHW